MPIKINGTEYYRTSEACTMAGITKNTFLRWVTNNGYSDVSHRDRRGWRLFTREDIEKLSCEVNRVRIDTEKNVLDSNDVERPVR
jgi:hypothetical protein